MEFEYRQNNNTSSTVRYFRLIVIIQLIVQSSENFNWKTFYRLKNLSNYALVEEVKPVVVEKRAFE